MTKHDAARVIVSGGILAALAWYLDVGEVAGRLARLRPGWIAAGVAVSVVQVAASAWRWRYTATRLGLHLPFSHALHEYYLASLLNQVLPGGIGGDVTRAWRHGARAARGGAPAGTAVRAVILERASGQIVMTAAALVSAFYLALTSEIADTPVAMRAGVPLGLAVAAAAGLAAAVRRARRRSEDASTRSGRFWRDARLALFSDTAPLVQLAGSILIVGTYLATFVIAARATGIVSPAVVLLPLVAPVLVAMLLPVSVAGWGVREGAAAIVWSSAGLGPEDGVAISIAYGAIVLIAALPGVVPVITAARDRTARHRRA